MINLVENKIPSRLQTVNQKSLFYHYSLGYYNIVKGINPSFNLIVMLNCFLCNVNMRRQSTTTKTYTDDLLGGNATTDREETQGTSAVNNGHGHHQFVTSVFFFRRIFCQPTISLALHDSFVYSLARLNKVRHHISK